MDFVEDKSRSLGPYKPYLHAYRSKSTKVSGKSPRIGGLLMIQENILDVTFLKRNGTSCMWAVGNSDQWFTCTLSNDFPTVNTSKVGGIEKLVQQEAIEKAYSFVANVQSSLAETIAERASTLNVFVQRARQIWQIYQDIRSGRLLSRRSRRRYRRPTERDIANTWLEYSFMWKPLMQDVITFAEGIQPIRGSRIVGRAENTITWVDPLKSGDFVGFNTSQRKVKAVCVLEVTLDDPLAAVQAEMGLFQLGSLWNIMPFSFVVDWFFSVGAFIERLCFPGKTIINGSLTTTTTDTAHNYVRRVGNYSQAYRDKPAVPYKSLGSGITTETVRKVRTVGVPSPFFISTNMNFSSWHVGTTWALLVSIFSRGR